MIWSVIFLSNCIFKRSGPGQLVLYHSPECTGYAEQAWKYMTICCINFHQCRSIRKQIWPCHKNGHGHGQPNVIILTNLVVHMYLSTRCCIPRFLVPKKMFEGFYHIWAWKPSWSCDQEHLKKISSHGGKFGFKWPSVFEEKKF